MKNSNTQTIKHIKSAFFLYDRKTLDEKQLDMTLDLLLNNLVNDNLNDQKWKNRLEKKLNVRFLLDGGISEIASGYVFDLENILVKFPSGQQNYIYPRDEGKIWKVV
jgi:hypothetical protein